MKKRDFFLWYLLAITEQQRKSKQKWQSLSIKKYFF
jgi:hypothetical protein